MSLLKLLYYPDRRLRKIAKPVMKIDNNIKLIIDNMFDTMYYEEGIGLAAPQVNVHKQIIVINISKKYDGQLVLINPEFLEKSGNISINEGCLSIPKLYGFVKRANKVKVCSLDKNGNSFKIEANGLLAVCIQHEMDHLVGKLFIDYFSLTERKQIYQNMKNLIYE